MKIYNTSDYHKKLKTINYMTKDFIGTKFLKYFYYCNKQFKSRSLKHAYFLINSSS